MVTHRRLRFDLQVAIGTPPTFSVATRADARTAASLTLTSGDVDNGKQVWASDAYKRIYAA